MRIVWTFLVAVVIGVGVGFAPKAYAMLANENEVFYYSDPEMTNQVGYMYVSCYGRRIMEGDTTAPYRYHSAGYSCRTGAVTSYPYCTKVIDEYGNEQVMECPFVDSSPY